MRSRADLPRILHQHESMIAGFFRARVSSREDAEDLIQEAACAIIGGYPRFRGKSAVSTWIYAICRNTLHVHYTRATRTRGLVDRLRAANAVAPSRASDHADEVIDAVLHDRLLDYAYEKLPRTCKTLLTEYYRFGRSVAEVAETIGRPEGTVKFLLYDLRRRLRDIVGDEE